ncbi:hypothetical protein BV898_00725 [Hypsibius exemplaris]|uniref:Uncharacterized protein n=1 Tax=Hypsibius exemplaris TaxID=2072580 RepID=A0A1W0XE93_HYPEX|nr:hypothetical protein BV898_00725 [Hypsibius exemplaris]
MPAVRTGEEISPHGTPRDRSSHLIPRAKYVGREELSYHDDEDDDDEDDGRERHMAKQNFRSHFPLGFPEVATSNL